MFVWPRYILIQNILYPECIQERKWGCYTRKFIYVTYLCWFNSLFFLLVKVFLTFQWYRTLNILDYITIGSFQIVFISMCPFKDKLTHTHTHPPTCIVNDRKPNIYTFVCWNNTRSQEKEANERTQSDTDLFGNGIVYAQKACPFLSTT